MNGRIITALGFCVILSAIGGFGAPLLCSNGNDKCADAWRGAAAGALTAAGALGTLLVRLEGDKQ